MRKSLLQDSLQGRDELIIDFKQTQDERLSMGGLLPTWYETWNRFESDIYSYFLPAMESQSQQMSEQPTVSNRLPSQQKPKHSFSFAYCQRQLKRVILIHANIDIFPEIRKQITRIFYKIANYFITNSLKIKPDNLFVSLIQGYIKIQSKLSVLIGCLNLVLNKFITRKGIQDQLYSIINKQLINHPFYQNYVDSCISSVQNLRNNCLQIKSLNSQNINFKQKQNQTIQNLKLLNRLKIFPYIQYLERSKKYYTQLLTKIPKNIIMFPVLHNLIKCEKILQSVIIPDQQKLQNAKKILKRQTWRALQPQSMIKVFCKQVLDQIYDDMIQYVDYLLSTDSNNTNNHQNVATSQQKCILLKYLWQLTKILQKNLKNEKQKQLRNLKYANVNNLNKKSQVSQTPSAKLLNRITTIITDIKKYIMNSQLSIQQISSKSNLYKIINFKDHILSIVSQCFQNDSKFLNSITIAIQQVIVSQQQSYNTQLCAIILSPYYIFPISSQNISESGEQRSREMIDEEQQTNGQKRKLNNKYSHQLFKLTPSKQQFIRKFQQLFSNYVLTSQNNIDLCEQQKFIKPIQKQSGHILSRNIQRMLNDVWRNGEMIYYKSNKMVCRILCQDWPHFTQSQYKLADSLLQIRGDFQAQFLFQTQNEKKKLKWIEECGKIIMKINGIQSHFSQLQASIIMLLSRSYRPIKGQQFKQVLQYTKNNFNSILTQLCDKNIIIYNIDASNYQLNYDNQTSYIFQQKQKQLTTKSIKKTTGQKDYGIVIQALIARILKRRKSVQKTDLAKLLSIEIKVDGRQPSIQQINNALERLRVKDIVNIQKTRGIIKYIQ